MDDLTLRNILKNTAYPYLAAFEKEWINADGETLSFDDMGKNYLERCYKMLVREKENVERGFFLRGAKYDKAQYDDIVEMTKELYDQKVTEIKKYLKM